MLHRFTLLSFSIFLCLTGISQKEFNIWHFGTTAIDFNSGDAVPLPVTSVVSNESTSGICNANGELLFYSNGGNSTLNPTIQGKIWNANHQVMPNGDLQNIAGCESTYQGIIIVPDPANGLNKTSSRYYYMLTIDCLENMIGSAHSNKGLRYTKIDMDLDNGLGDVVEKGIPIVEMPAWTSYSTDKEVLTAMPHANGNDYWILFGHRDSIGRVLLTAGGFSAPSYQAIIPYFLCASPANNKLAVHNVLYDFDPQTGLLSAPQTLAGRNACFSPDGRFLYLKDNSTLRQYDVTAANVSSTAVVLSTSASGRPILAPDHRIYFMGDGNNPIVQRINCPNSGGTSCDFDPSYSLQLTGTVRSGNPNYLQRTFYYPGDPCNEPLAVREEENSGLLAYPNPGSGLFRLRHNYGQLNISITDINGRTITSLSVKSDEQIDLRYLGSGIYFIVPEGSGRIIRFELLN